MAERKNSFVSERLDWASRVIEQNQYVMLDDLTPMSVDEETKGLAPSDVTCLFRITRLVKNASENGEYRLISVLNALQSCGATCLLLLRCIEGTTELYLGAVNKARYDNTYFLNTIREVLRTGLVGSIPGIEIEEVVAREAIDQLFSECINDDFESQCVTSMSCVPGEVGKKAAYDHGFEQLMEAIGDRNFSILVLADSVDRPSMQAIRRGYEVLGTQLSASEQVSLAVQQNSSISHSEGRTENFSISIGDNVSLTQSHSQGSGWSKASESEELRRKRMANGTAGLLTDSYVAMNALAMFVEQGQNTVSGHEDHSVSAAHGRNVNLQHGNQQNKSDSQSISCGNSITRTTKDYRVHYLLERVNAYLGWLNRQENFGMFDACAYVVSSSAGVNLMVASQYQALLQGEREITQPVTINTWSPENGVEVVRDCLMHLSHPRFRHLEFDGVLTPGMLMSGRELSRQMALPRRSILGVTVTEHAAFGRDVVRESPLRDGKIIRAGCVSHMGKSLERQPVLLDLQSMASHTFVTGTNGSGKSNAVFCILEEFQRAGVPFLVIEPAKGEYKNVFGFDDGVAVYGTNPTITPLLHMNPLWFNDSVMVYEHIDRLVEVFNASWSMSAAMPAVLKASLEGAYVQCGWDIATSTHAENPPRFPTLKDVFAQIEKEMESTTFSQEVRDNYIGALSTRLKSLCNGVFAQIFGSGNLSDEELFERSVIVDLSRIGSSETKAMIMGFLVIRLQEYRMGCSAMNMPLSHVTVLEEAHHLLRRTSSAQTDEGTNMLGKSVEMISNAIAEMRSYGEGFVIVDQSPGLLDASVLRNTNTKLVLRLPEGTDREVVAASIGLTKEQAAEIFRLPTGVCAIYQKDWLETVLCKVDKASHTTRLFVRPDENLGKAVDDAKEDMRIRRGSTKNNLRGMGSLALSLFNMSEALEQSREGDVGVWVEDMLSNLRPSMDGLSRYDQQTILLLMLSELASRNPDFALRYLEAYEWIEKEGETL